MVHRPWSATNPAVDRPMFSPTVCGHVTRCPYNIGNTRGSQDAGAALSQVTRFGSVCETRLNHA